MKEKITLLLIAVLSSACGSGFKTGYYSSKKAEIGFFITKIQLNADSTFKYEFYGDLAYDRATGKYSIDNKILSLEYDQIPSDSLDQLSKVLASQFAHGRPNKLYIKNKKLFISRKNNDLGEMIPLIKKDRELTWRNE